MSGDRSLLRAGQAAWRALLPPRTRAALGSRIEHNVRRLVLRDARLAPVERIARGPLVVSTYGDKAFGIGRAGRLTLAALREAGLAPVEHDMRAALEDRRIGAGALPGGACGGVWLQHCNPGDAAVLLGHIDQAHWAGRYRIGYWAWELPRAPRFWLWMSRFFHEIWVPSRFVGDALAGAGAPLRVMPHPVRIAPTPQPRNDVIRVLTMADLASSCTRKNPIGAIEAFTRAFPEQQQAVDLIIKLSDPGFDPNALARIKAAMTGRRDVWLMKDTLTDADADALIRSTDVFLSLHRSEGFGLGIAEAMAHGRAVLATAWSGNTDMMAGMTDALVPARLTPVADEAGIYTMANTLWAEPDLGLAAAKLRALATDAALRERLGAAGVAAIARQNEAWSGEALTAQPWFGLIAR